MCKVMKSSPRAAHGRCSAEPTDLQACPLLAMSQPCAAAACTLDPISDATVVSVPSGAVSGARRVVPASPSTYAASPLSSAARAAISQAEQVQASDSSAEGSGDPFFEVPTAAEGAAAAAAGLSVGANAAAAAAEGPETPGAADPTSTVTIR